MIETSLGLAEPTCAPTAVAREFGRQTRGYLVRIFLDLSITSHAGNSVMAKNFFTAKDFRLMTIKNLPDHENRLETYRRGYVSQVTQTPAETPYSDWTLAFCT